MTKQKLLTILNTNSDVTVTTDTALTLTNISSLLVSNDTILYPNPNDTRFVISSGNADVLLIYNGKVIPKTFDVSNIDPDRVIEEENCYFVQNSVIPSAAISIDTIYGVYLTSNRRRSEAYKFGGAV